MAVEIDVVYSGGLRCEATHGPSKNSLPTDAPVDNGGRGAAFSPTDLVATALGTCMLTIMGLGARLAGIDIDGTRAHVVKEMTKTGLRRIEELRVTISLPSGLQLTQEQRAIMEKAVHSCPVKQSLHPDVKVVVEFE